jgi:hypothetical protein
MEDRLSEDHAEACDTNTPDREAWKTMGFSKKDASSIS